VLSALALALADPDVTVKTYALYALASRGGDEAIGALRQALQNPDVSIRTMVLEEAARTGEGQPLLQEALSNDDATIRALAAFWLEEAAAKEP
jgi:HEAT repeat protein